LKGLSYPPPTIRPHRSTMYVDAAYCYRPSSVVCRSVCQSVCLSVCHTSEPCKNGYTDRDVVWVEDSGEPRNHVLYMGPRFPHGKGQFRGEKGRPIVKYRDTLQTPASFRSISIIVSSWSIQPFGDNTPTSQTDRQTDRQTGQRSDRTPKTDHKITWAWVHSTLSTVTPKIEFNFPLELLKFLCVLLQFVAKIVQCYLCDSAYCALDLSLIKICPWIGVTGPHGSAVATRMFRFHSVMFYYDRKGEETW